MEVNPNSASFPLIQKNSLKFVETKAEKSSLRKIVTFLKFPNEHFPQVSQEDKEKLKTYLKDKHAALIQKPTTRRESVVRFFKSIVQWILNRGQSSKVLAEKGLAFISEHEHDILNQRLSDIQKKITHYEQSLNDLINAKKALENFQSQNAYKGVSEVYRQIHESKIEKFNASDLNHKKELKNFNEAIKELDSLHKEIKKSNFDDLTKATFNEKLKINLLKIKAREEPLKSSGAFYIDSKDLSRVDPQVINEVIPQFLEQIDQSVVDFKIVPGRALLKFETSTKDRYGAQNGVDQVNSYGFKNLNYAITSGYYRNADGKRYGDPIADDILLSSYLSDDGGSVYIMGVSDGSGHGTIPMEAAIAANKGFEAHCLARLAHGVTTKRSLAHMVLEGVLKAQEQLPTPPEADVDDIKKLSETTFSGTIIKTNANGTNATAVIATVGDLKYFVKRADGTVEEITKGNRPSAGMRDPGGRITNETVDLRNLGLFIVDLQKGDTLLAMSDGVHDNLNPATVEYLSPEEVYQNLMNSPHLDKDSKERLESIKGKIPAKWIQSGEITEEMSILQDAYMANRIMELDRNGDGMTPLSEKLTHYSYQIGKESRDYATSDNKSQNAPQGKIDHISCAEVKI